MATTDARVRAFVAIELGDAARVAAARLIDRLRPMPARVSWVRAENLHVTLRFLGEVSGDQIETIAAHMQPELTVQHPFSAAIRGLGAFPNARRPSVIWIGYEDTDNAATGISAIAERAARGIGLVPETRPFVPHVTLGRVRRESPKSDISAFLEAESRFDAGAFTVDAVSLFSSELTPHGARYTRLHRLTLDGLPSARGV